MTTYEDDGRRGSSWRTGTVAIAVAVATVLVAANGALARSGGTCSTTARIQFAACLHEVNDDLLITRATCINLADPDAKAECTAEISGQRAEGNQLCREQREARFAVCDLLGEDPYDPPFDPDDFETGFTNPTVVNPYLPLVVGNHWEFVALDAGETNTVEVLAKTKLIDGVTCVVSRDLVLTDGVAKEFTDDWLAQATAGDVVYCGEQTEEFEVFAGDVPPDPELVGIEGSFKAGRDGDKQGTLFLGTPTVGASYRQEYSPSNAEDVATVLSTTYGFGVDMALDEHVPEALANLLCDHDCVVTEEITPLEPGAVARKYYAAGIGVFLEVELDSGEVNQLVGCNVDPRCATLPAP